MKTIIVDDEPKAIALLEGYLRHFSELELVGSFRNGLKALSFLNTRPVDLIFLDINMPHISGVALARILDERTSVIFTTAYSEYAVESYELAAVDYLLKPITLERFAKAIRKVIQPGSIAFESQSVPKPQTLLVKSGSKMYRLDPTRIYYLEKDHNYMIYHLEEEKILARQSAAEALKTLPENFLQIHKSYIVNRDHIQYFDRHEISVKGRTLSLGLSFREHFLATMQD